MEIVVGGMTTADIAMAVGHVINVIGLVTIAIGVLKSVLGTIHAELLVVQNIKPISVLMHVRRNLAIYLLLGLEFVVAADIIHTMIHFDMHNLLLLGLLVVIRIVIGYVLEKEIKTYEKEHPEEIAEEEKRLKKTRASRAKKV